MSQNKMINIEFKVPAKITWINYGEYKRNHSEEEVEVCFYEDWDESTINIKNSSGKIIFAKCLDQRPSQD